MTILNLKPEKCRKIPPKLNATPRLTDVLCYLISVLFFWGGGVWRCREVEQDVATLKAQLVEKQAVQTENDRLKLQLNSMQAQSLMEQRKTAEEKSEKTQAYIHINWLCESAETEYCVTDLYGVVLLYFHYIELYKAIRSLHTDR